MERFNFLFCRFCLLSLLCSLFFYGTAGAVSLEAQTCYEEGMACLEEGKLDEALEKFNAAVALDPNYVEALKDRGNAYYFKGELELALKDYLKVISLAPGIWQAYNNAANVYWDQGNIQKAMEYYEKAIEANPSECLPYSNLGLLHLDIKQYSEACEYFRKIIEIEPQNYVAYRDLGYTLYEMKQEEEAIIELQNSLSINPDYIDPYITLGKIYYNRAVKLNREFVETENETAMEGAYNSYQEANKNYKKAVELEPENARYRYLLGLTYFGLTEDDKALEEYRIAIDHARAQGDDAIVALIQDQIKVIQELKEKREQGGGNK